MTDRHDSSGVRARPAAAPPGAWRDVVRDLLRRRTAPRPHPVPAGYFERATCVSFRMDGLPLSEADFRAALERVGTRGCRTRAAQRVRNHVAVLRRIETLLARAQPLHTADVVRWYTSVACGLSAGGIADAAVDRIERIVSAVNSPRLRFLPAVKEVAALHVALLADPFVPGFNGILTRLLLRYHMGRCRLPPVVFDPETDPPLFIHAGKLEARLLELIARSFDGNGRT